MKKRGKIYIKKKIEGKRNLFIFLAFLVSLLNFFPSCYGKVICSIFQSHTTTHHITIKIFTKNKKQFHITAEEKQDSGREARHHTRRAR